MHKNAARDTRSFDLLLVWKHGMSQKQQKRFLQGNEETGEPHNTLISVHLCPHPFRKFLCNYWLKYVCVTSNITCSALENYIYSCAGKPLNSHRLVFLFLHSFWSFLFYLLQFLRTRPGFRIQRALYYVRIYIYTYVCLSAVVTVYIYVYIWFS